MEPKIIVAQSQIVVHYKLAWDDGERYTFFTMPVSPGVADLYGSINADYAFIGITFPARSVYPFVSGVQIPRDFIREKLDVDIRTAGLLAAIMPKLTAVAPADDIVTLATAWKVSNPYVKF